MMKLSHSFMLFGALLLAGAALTAQAAVIDQGLWHLGEADPGAATGNTGNMMTVDSSGNGDNLTRSGSPTYTSVAAPHSTIAMSFSGNGTGYQGNVATTVTNNWGIEIWADPSSASENRATIYNGNTANSGFGIYEIGGTWEGVIGGLVFVGSAPVTLNTYTDLALVDNNGTTTLYVNGVASGSTTTVTPHTPTGSFLIGENNGGTENFIGLLDEGRVFTFAPGQFSTADLLINIPEPAGMGLAGLSLILLGTLARRSRRRIPEQTK